ncbi:hypothetical protein ACFX19_027645 [Malus domestica]
MSRERQSCYALAVVSGRLQKLRSRSFNVQALVLDQIFIFFVCCHAVDGKLKLGDALVSWLPGLSALK